MTFQENMTLVTQAGAGCVPRPASGTRRQGKYPSRKRCRAAPPASGREGKPGETGDFGKAVGSPVIRCAFGAESAGHRLEPHRKAALVPRSLVLVDHLLVGDAVDDAARIAQDFPRGG